jgi:hypothetical protein
VARISRQWRWPIRTHVCCGCYSRQRGLPPPGRRLSGAPEKNLPKELRRLSAKLMANRSDQHLSNLSNSQGATPVRLIRRRCADFHHGPECNAALHQQAGYMTAIAHQAIRAATLRTGLGPYMRVRIDCAPPSSPSLYGSSARRWFRVWAPPSRESRFGPRPGRSARLPPPE